MAKLTIGNSVQPYKIDKFLGLNLSNTGDTQLQMGESGNMTNFYITNDYKLRKIFGYKCFYDFGEDINGMYATNLGGTEYLLVACDGKLYYFLKSNLDDDYLVVPEKVKTFTGDGTTTTFDLLLTNIESVDKVEIGGEEVTGYTPNLTSGTITFTTAPANKAFIKVNFTKQLSPTLIGTIGNSTDVSFFTFDKKVYILSGKYQSWDGTTLQEVAGYTPLVFINTPPAGGGLIYDEINMLSSKKHQQFNGDGTSTVYQLAQKGITSVDKVLVGGEEKTVTTDYTVNLANGTVTFVGTAPPQGMDNVDIYWTLNDGDRSKIEKMKFGTIFGGDLDTRVFLYGNPDCPNRTYFSGLCDGVPSVEYFPATAQVDIGPSNFALTDLTRQYDRLLATTNKPEAYYLTIGTETLDVTLSDNSTTQRYVPAVSTFPLNETHGNVAMGQGQLIDNYPVTIDRNALTLWKATNVRDEKNMEDISQKIKLNLIDSDLEYYKTLDHQSANQLWFGINRRFFIYNYFNKTYSRLFLNDDMTHLVDLGNEIYSGSLDGKVFKWGEQFDDFDGEIINAHWEMNFSDFGVAHLRKTMSRLWVLMQPQGYASADIGFITNIAESNEKKHIEYKNTFLEDVDFGDFRFTINVNPQPFRLKLKAKKFTNLKITIDNTERTDCTILQLILRVESFGESK